MNNKIKYWMFLMLQPFKSKMTIFLITLINEWGECKVSLPLLTHACNLTQHMYTCMHSNHAHNFLLLSLVDEEVLVTDFTTTRPLSTSTAMPKFSIRLSVSETPWIFRLSIADTFSKFSSHKLRIARTVHCGMTAAVKV